MLRKLVARADVLVENFISGKLASMGLGWEECHKINPRLIYASITGPFILTISAAPFLNERQDMASRSIRRDNDVSNSV